MNYIIIIGAVQALLAIGLIRLFQVKGAENRDHILTFLLGAILLHLAYNFVSITSWPSAQIHKGFYTFLALLYPILLWLYSEKIADPGQKRDKRILLHFLPVLVDALFYFYIAIDTIYHKGKTPTAIQSYNEFTTYLYLFTYLVYPIAAWKKASSILGFWKQEKRFILSTAALFSLYETATATLFIRKNILSFASTTWDSHLYMRILLYTILLLVIVHIIFLKVHSFYYLHMQAAGQPLEKEPKLLPKEEIDSITILPQPLHAAIAQDKKHIPPLSVNLSSIEEKGLNIDFLHILEKIEPLMQVRKIYTDSELTLDKLALMANISRHHLSATFNQYLGKSFYQYINEYRIERVKQIMDASRNTRLAPNILSIAYEAGFHSKSSFNQYFKKVVGCTPSYYLNNGASDHIKLASSDSAVLS